MNTKLKNNTVITCAAIGGIVILESIALIMGLNGTILTIAVAAVAGLAGWSAPQLKLTKK